MTASPSTITAPGQSLTLTYSGAAFGSTVTTSINVNLTVGSAVIPLPIPVKRQYLYVAHTNSPVGTPPTGGGVITVYTFGASGTTLPVRTISGVLSGITTPIKPLVDNNGTLYVLDNNIPVSTAFNPTIRVFAPGANGNVAPIRQITNLGSVTGSQACSDMAFDPTGNFLFVTCGLDFYVFPASANGTAASANTASYNDDGGDTSNGLAFDQSGNLYIADQAGSVIRVYTGPIPTVWHPLPDNRRREGALPSSVMAIGRSTSTVLSCSRQLGHVVAPIWFQSASSGPTDSQAELANLEVGGRSAPTARRARF